jgi:hypothetical protein
MNFTFLPITLETHIMFKKKNYSFKYRFFNCFAMDNFQERFLLMVGCMLLFHIIDHFSIFLFSQVCLQTFHPYITNFVVVQSNKKTFVYNGCIPWSCFVLFISCFVTRFKVLGKTYKYIVVFYIFPYRTYI